MYLFAHNNNNNSELPTAVGSLKLSAGFDSGKKTWNQIVNAGGLMQFISIRNPVAVLNELNTKSFCFALLIEHWTVVLCI